MGVIWKTMQQAPLLEGKLEEQEDDNPKVPIKL